MTNHQSILDYYTAPGPMTSAGNHSKLIKDLPGDIPSLVKVVQGLAVHQYVAEPFYGLKLSDERINNESHLRRFDQMLDCVLGLDPAPLITTRPPGRRLVGVCHHFALLLVGILRAKGIPARSRYGFGDYFNPGFYEDHSLCEYWNAQARRWVLVDPQFDEAWCRELHIQHNIYDVPRDHFLVSGDAWVRCRTDQADPNTFGIFNNNLRGLWFVAGTIVKDIAALNKQELLQWDSWGVTPAPGTQLTLEEQNQFDNLSNLSRDPDVHFKELQHQYNDPAAQLKVTERVFNAMRQRLEAL